MATQNKENVQPKGREMKKYIRLFFILTLLFSISLFYLPSSKIALGGNEEKKNPSSTKPANALTWYKYDEGLAKAKKEKKHVLVAFYTNWCGWCKRMDKNTYGDEEVKKFLKKSYVAIKVNAESKEKVEVDGKKLTESELAREYRVRSFPVTWFLKQSGEKIAPYLGYVDAPTFLNVLNYMKDDLYDKMSFEEYMKNQDKNKGNEKK